MLSSTGNKIKSWFIEVPYTALLKSKNVSYLKIPNSIPNLKMSKLCGNYCIHIYNCMTHPTVFPLYIVRDKSIPNGQVDRSVLG
jgi:hypothetical protein